MGCYIATPKCFSTHHCTVTLSTQQPHLLMQLLLKKQCFAISRLTDYRRERATTPNNNETVKSMHFKDLVTATFLPITKWRKYSPPYFSLYT